jgi:Domain of unknown function (DUF4328)
LRCWDGQARTGHVAAGAVGGSGGQRIEDVYADEAGLTPWATVSTIVHPVVAVLASVIDLATASAWRTFFHRLRVIYDTADTGAPAPHVAPFPPWGSLLAPLTLAAEVVFLLWQYRAATTARRLGFPARRSPGLGVGSYFIPVVQLWFPYQALRDCLPPNREHRRLVLVVWLLLIVSGVISASQTILLAEVRSLGVALLAVSVVLGAALAVGGYRMVRAISASHKEATSVST